MKLFNKFFLILACALAAMGVQAATYYVNDANTLKTGLENAANGDVIVLTSDITLPSKWQPSLKRQVTITSGEGGPYVLTQGGSGNNAGYISLEEKNVQLTLQNVIIDGGNQDGRSFVDVSKDNVSLTIGPGVVFRNFKSNQASVVMQNGASLTITDSVFSNCTAAVSVKTANCATSITGSYFENNTSGVDCYAVTVSDSRFENNGTAVRNQGALRMTDSLMVSNTVAAVTAGAAVSMTNVQIADNAGTGIRFNGDYDIALTNVVITGNADGVLDAGYARLKDVQITNNAGKGFTCGGYKSVVVEGDTYITCNAGGNLVLKHTAEKKGTTLQNEKENEIYLSGLFTGRIGVQYDSQFGKIPVAGESFGGPVSDYAITENEAYGFYSDLDSSVIGSLGDNNKFVWMYKVYGYDGTEVKYALGVADNDQVVVNDQIGFDHAWQVTMNEQEQLFVRSSPTLTDPGEKTTMYIDFTGFGTMNLTAVMQAAEGADALFNVYLVSHGGATTNSLLTAAGMNIQRDLTALICGDTMLVAEFTGDSQLRQAVGYLCNLEYVTADGSAESPFPVAAATDVAGIIDFISQSGMTEAYMVLGDNITSDIVVPAGASLVIDLNGKTLTGSVSGGGNITIVDSSKTASGRVTGSVSANGTLAIDGGTYSFDPENYLTDGVENMKQNDGTWFVARPLSSDTYDHVLDTRPGVRHVLAQSDVLPITYSGTQWVNLTDDTHTAEVWQTPSYEREGGTRLWQEIYTDVAHADAYLYTKDIYTVWDWMGLVDTYASDVYHLESEDYWDTTGKRGLWRLKHVVNGVTIHADFLFPNDADTDIMKAINDKGLEEPGYAGNNDKTGRQDYDDPSVPAGSEDGAYPTFHAYWEVIPGEATEANPGNTVAQTPDHVFPGKSTNVLIDDIFGPGELTWRELINDPFEADVENGDKPSSIKVIIDGGEPIELYNGSTDGWKDERIVFGGDTNTEHTVEIIFTNSSNTDYTKRAKQVIDDVQWKPYDPYIQPSLLNDESCKDFTVTNVGTTPTNENGGETHINGHVVPTTSTVDEDGNQQTSTVNPTGGTTIDTTGTQDYWYIAPDPRLDPSAGGSGTGSGTGEGEGGSGSGEGGSGEGGSGEGGSGSGSGGEGEGGSGGNPGTGTGGDGGSGSGSGTEPGGSTVVSRTPETLSPNESTSFVISGVTGLGYIDWEMFVDEGSDGEEEPEIPADLTVTVVTTDKGTVTTNVYTFTEGDFPGGEWGKKQVELSGSEDAEHTVTYTFTNNSDGSGTGYVKDIKWKTCSVALMIVDHEDPGDGWVYLAFKPQINPVVMGVEELREWVMKRAKEGRIFVKYGRTRSECEACAPVATELSSRLGTEENKVWVRVKIKDVVKTGETVIEPVGYWRIWIEMPEKDWEYSFNFEVMRNLSADAEDAPAPKKAPGAPTGHMGAKSINVFGILKIDSARTNTLVAVPWTWYSEIEPIAGEIPVNKLVKPTNIDDGDLLYAYARDMVYACWVMVRDEDSPLGRWEPCNTAYVDGIGKGSVAFADADEVDEMTIARGKGLWVVRKRPCDENGKARPFWIYGQSVETGVVTEIEPITASTAEKYTTGMSKILGNPYWQPVRINDLIFTGDINPKDTIVVPDENNNEIYLIYNPDTKNGRGNWARVVEVKVKKGPIWLVQNDYDYEMTVKPGQAFWYVRRGTTELTIEWPMPSESQTEEAGE